MGILLTGASSDGARGLSAIHDAGGFTVVQEPRSAAVANMPAAALALFEPDCVLELEDIASLLAGFGAERDT
jgi:two-component system chemotaxis response regulator CheB